MRKISFALAIIILMGCSAIRPKPESEGNLINAARIGMGPLSVNGKLIVKGLTDDFPAKLAGLKIEDVIVSADGKAVTTAKELVTILNNKQPGDHILLVIDRNGEALKFDIVTKLVKMRRTVLKIIDLLDEKKRVNIAVIVSEVKNSFSYVSGDWVASMRNNVQSYTEMMLLSNFGQQENFSVVDRTRLKHILDEYNFSQSGFVSDKLRARIGEMTGATYLFDISFSRFRSRDYEKDDIVNSRLIEIESGKILAVDQVKTH